MSRRDIPGKPKSKRVTSNRFRNASGKTAQNFRSRTNANHLKIRNTAPEIERQALLLYAANRLATILLASDDKEFAASLRKGMELMAYCLDIDRIYIWQNEMKDGELHYVQKFGWLNTKGGREKNVSYETSFSYTESIPEWVSEFTKGECVNGPIRSLTQAERERLGPYGIKSILVIPVHLQGFFWGFVSFDDCHRERIFSDDEVSILRSGSLMVVNAMIRNEIAARMHEADERVKLMLDATPLCCYLMNNDLSSLDCNEEAVKLFELKDKQEYLDKFYELSPKYQPDGEPSTDKAKRLVEEAFKVGKIVFEWMHQRLDGTLIPSEMTLVRVKHGDKYIVACYTRDLREYKKMMREIEYKDKLLHTVNEVASILLQPETSEFEDNLWRCMSMMADSVDIDRVYIWKNHIKDGQLCSTQLYEWSEGAKPQQGGKCAVDVPYSEIAPRWITELSSGQCINSLVRHLPKSEQKHLSTQDVLSVLIAPLFLREEFWGFIGFDDCHRERTFSIDEETILRSGGLLIANALLRNEMTSDIRTAIENAQEASRAKGNFLANMSHEIRTPMNAIIGMTSIGKSASDIERKNYAFGKIEDASNHLLGVINDILDLSKVEANKLELLEAEFDFEKMLQNVVNVVSFRMDEKQQRFTVHIDKDIPQTLIGDDLRISQVITNLLSNSMKFTPEQGLIRLEARFIKEEDGICDIQIEVIDSGIGMSDEEQSRIFTSFEQADKSTSRKFGGTGLGLAISKHIIELMGGNILVKSVLGEGSAFSFILRLARGKEECHSPSSSKLKYKNVKILVVDNESETLELFMGIAERFKITCDIALDEKEAIKSIATKTPYDIYFLDWNMPDISGIELIHKIKAKDASKPIITLVSTIECNAIQQDAGTIGIDAFLPKPLFSSAIVDCINKFISTDISSAPADVKTNKTESLQGYCILLAEDMEINREIAIAMLEQTQVMIDCAENGAEAVRMFFDKPERYDMIFMDMQMPELDGLEATKLIRGLGFPKAEEVPIVAMTANVFKEDIEKCLDAGMNGHVGKPINLVEMLDKIKQYLPIKQQ